MKSKAGVLVCLVAAGLVSGTVSVLAGCQKQTPTPPTKGTTAKATPGQPAAQVTEQTTCPVMGGAINKDIFVEYQGKKVYFCCKECVEKFNADPQKYVAKLPQFANK